MSNQISLTIEKTVLLNALSNVQAVVANRNTMAILNNVKLDAEGGKLTITATDLDILVSESIAANIITSGSLTVNARALFDIIRKTPDDSVDIRGNADTGKIQIKGKSCRFSLPCLNSDEFPIIDRGDLDCEFDINAIDFLKLLNKTKFAVSNNEAQYYLNGVNLHTDDDKLISCGTNGHKLAKVSIDFMVDNFPNIILSTKSVGIIAKIFDKPTANIKIAVSTTKICIACDDTSLIAKLIDGTFPDVNRCIPIGNDKIFNINRELILKSIDRVSLAASAKTSKITLSIKSNIATLSAKSDESGDAADDLEIACDIEDFKINFNSKYAIEILSNIDSETVDFNMQDSKTGIIINTPNNNNDIYIVMPMGD